MTRTLIALVLLAGCGDTLPMEVAELGNDARQVPVELEITPLGYAVGADFPDFSTAPIQGGLVVVGGYSVPQGGYELRANAWEQSSIIRLELSLVMTSGGITIPLGFGYHAGMTDIAPGQYEFQLVFVSDERRTLVHRSKVNIP
jgi:hypothetical protein